MTNEVPDKVIEPKNPKKSKKRLISNLIFLLAMTILVVTLVLSLGELEEIGKTLGRIGQSNNWVYLLIAILLTLIYFAIWPLTLHIFAKSTIKDVKFKDSYFIGCSEHFYNGVTPFATGGQPFQVYSYSKCGVKPSEGTGIVLANFVTFMIITNLFAIVSLAFWPYFSKGLETIGGQNYSWFKIVAIIGFVINFLVLLFMISLGTSKHVKRAIIKLVELLSKIKFLKKPLTKALPLFEDYCSNAQLMFKSAWAHKKAFFLSLIVKFITMGIYYSIPFFIMLSVGITLTPFDFVLSLFGTSFAITAVVFMPTPGGTGGIELAFSIVMASISSGILAESTAVALIWRLLTYYGLMLLSFVFTAIHEGMTNKRMKIEEENLAIEETKK